jgi:hypothetical protein
MSIRFSNQQRDQHAYAKHDANGTLRRRGTFTNYSAARRPGSALEQL